MGSPFPFVREEGESIRAVPSFFNTGGEWLTPESPDPRYSNNKHHFSGI